LGRGEKKEREREKKKKKLCGKPITQARYEPGTFDRSFKHK